MEQLFRFRYFIVFSDRAYLVKALFVALAIMLHGGFHANASMHIPVFCTDNDPWNG